MKNTTININFFTKRNQSKNPQKLLTNNHTVSLHQKHPKKTRQYLQLPKNPKHLHELLTFQDNPYTFEERHARLSEPLEPVQRQAPLSEPTYNLYPTLPQELSRIRNISQNQNTVEINRQIIHPRRNRNFQTPEFILIYPNPHQQVLQKTQLAYYRKPLHFFHNVAPQVYPQIT